MKQKPKVLVICTGNSMRSQMAEGILRHHLGDRIDVYSAGTHPSFVHSRTLEALTNAGIDTTGLRSKSVNEFIGEDIDLVITVCDSARSNCPTLPGAIKVVHKPYWDPYHMAPSDDPVAIFAELRDKMTEELVELVRQEFGFVD